MAIGDAVGAVRRATFGEGALEVAGHVVVLGVVGVMAGSAEGTAWAADEFETCVKIRMGSGGSGGGGGGHCGSGGGDGGVHRGCGGGEEGEEG